MSRHRCRWCVSNVWVGGRWCRWGLVVCVCLGGSHFVWFVIGLLVRHWCWWCWGGVRVRMCSGVGDVVSR